MKTSAYSAKIIEFIQTHKQFSVNDVAASTGYERKKTLRLLNKFCREGFLQLKKEQFITPKEKEMGPPRKNPIFARLQDMSLRRPARQESKRDKVWRTLRYIKKGTRSDIIRLSGCTHAVVENYTVLLSRYN